MTRPLFNYHTVVYDPQQDQTVEYKFRAMTDGQAIQSSKDGYTGLLGNYEETQKQLEVTIISKSLSDGS